MMKDEQEEGKGRNKEKLPRFFFSFGSTAQFRPWPLPGNFPFHFSY
jgi:hypothetical protein